MNSSYMDVDLETWGRAPTPETPARHQDHRDIYESFEAAVANWPRKYQVAARHVMAGHRYGKSYSVQRFLELRGYLPCPPGTRGDGHTTIAALVLLSQEQWRRTAPRQPGYPVGRPTRKQKHHNPRGTVYRRLVLQLAGDLPAKRRLSSDPDY